MRFGKRLLFGFTIGLAAVLGCSEEPVEPAPDATVNQPPAATLPASPLASPADYEFAEPVRLKAGDEFVMVESPGYACPTMADVDGDGKEDLVVGQFNSGQMQFFKNVADADAEPEFAKGEWLMTGGERAVVPGVW